MLITLHNAFKQKLMKIIIVFKETLAFYRKTINNAKQRDKSVY